MLYNNTMQCWGFYVNLKLKALWTMFPLSKLAWFLRYPMLFI